MSPTERHAWILDHMEGLATWYRDRSHVSVNVVDRYFVDAYITATGARAAVMPYGADKCPQLGRDLGVMYRAGKLTRYACGLEGVSGMGFPRWVWVYKLP